MHHILDNAAAGLCEVMQSYKARVHQAKELCRIIRRPETQPRLIERCFSHGVGPFFADRLKQIRGHIHEKRWGTVDFTVPELLRIEQAMRWGWDKHRFLHGDFETGKIARRRWRTVSPHAMMQSQILRSGHFGSRLRLSRKS